jgi:hypothetical protein
MLPQDGRAVLDTMIQSSTVDLFHTLGIAVAPLPSTRADPASITTRALMSVISFNGAGMAGSLGMLVPTGVFELVKQDPVRPFTGPAWVQDSVNQLLGRIKARLLQFQVTIQMGLPLALDEKGLKQIITQGILATYRFRTLRGEIAITLSGKIDFGKLNYSNQTTFANEGDIIIF